MTQPACSRSDEELFAELDAGGSRLEHARTCVACQARLASYERIRAELTRDLDAGASSHWRQRVLATIDGPAGGRRVAAPSRWRAWGVGLAVAAVTLIVAVLGSRWHEQQQQSAVLATLLSGPRIHEWRVSLPIADRYRPYNPARASNPRASYAPVDLGPLAGSDRRVLGVAQLLAGMLPSAEAMLPEEPASADALNDRAALALAQGRADRALSLLDRALSLSPGHRQALWNRALVLERQNQKAQAAALFSTIAGFGEPGWAEEAGARANRLRASSLPQSPPGR